MGRILENINSPADVKKLNQNQKLELCEELRSEIVNTVSKNGGHLASNLGVVELTVALFSVFDMDKDTVVWDVGHQTYAHKLLTGRYKEFSTLRKFGGISGFPSRSESIYDPFTTGHSSASISSALGVNWGNVLSGSDGHTVAVIGDGSLTGGLAFEGLNNAGRIKRNFIVILNDNEMSISRNVGGLAKYLGKLRAKPGYIRAKDNVEKAFDKLPGIGPFIASIIRKFKNWLKSDIVDSTIFDDLGFEYYGPFDGNNLKLMTEVLTAVKNVDKPVLVHIRTQKGKGYCFAEDTPSVYHGVSPFNVETGADSLVSESFSSVFGDKLCDLAEKDKRICAVTAAMASGTGLQKFSEEYSERFFDCGIAEEHAVTFCAGLAEKGMIPVFAVYSTFLQRAYDNLIHDIALNGFKAVLAVDRAGVVGEDGKTHNGVFDASYLRSVPGIQVFSPSYYSELNKILDRVFSPEENGLLAVRYPRGQELYKPEGFESSAENFDVLGPDTADIAIVCYGRLFSYACMAVNNLKDKNIKIIKLNRIIPVDNGAVAFAMPCSRVLFFEEGIKSGGIGEGFLSELVLAGFKGKAELHAIENGFVPHGSMQEILSWLGLDDRGMEKAILKDC